MVILEIDREFDRFENLLGAHNWSEFLKNPTPDESQQISKVFYSRFGSGREAQKHGARNLSVNEKQYN
jgi:hypothetical protein